MRGIGVTQTVEIARPFQRSFIFLPRFIAFSASIWLLLVALLTDTTIIPGHGKRYRYLAPYLPPSTLSFYIFEYPPARAKYSYHVARLGLSVVRHSFPTFFFASKLLFLSRSLSPFYFYFYHASVCGSPISRFYLVYRLRAFALLHDVLLSIHI